MRFYYGLFLFAIGLVLLSYCPDGQTAVTASQDGLCPEESKEAAECAEKPSSRAEGIFPALPEHYKLQEIPAESKRGEESPAKEQKAVERPSKTPGAAKRPFVVYFFWGRGCPHCNQEKPFLEEMTRRFPTMVVRDYEVWYNQENARLFSRMAKAYGLKSVGVPVTFIGDLVHVGFKGQSKEEIVASLQGCANRGCISPLNRMEIFERLRARGTEQISSAPERKRDDRPSEPAASGRVSEERVDMIPEKERAETLSLPLIGTVDASRMSLPLLTFVIAGLDSFNPCAFFVLLSLLGLLVHAQSRKKMFFIGSVFVFFSGFIYFIFMSAWLNLFLLMGQVAAITRIAGAVSIVIATINIKDFFAFKKGVSLTIPDSAKPKLFDRMRRLLKSTSGFSILLGTAVLAIAANSYELLCTAGFPMVFTRILTLNSLPSLSYYLYLVFYNIVYVIPLSLIVIAFTVTLGRKKLTEWQGRVLKLLSGTMMLGLGVVLVLEPSLLNNVYVSLFLLLAALLLSWTIIFFSKRGGFSP